MNRLIKVTKNGTIVAEYAYDPEGLRVVKRAKGETTHYVFEGTEPLFEKKISTGKIKSYVYALGKYLARVDGVIGDTEAKKYFYHTDHTGSIRVITDQAGKVVFNADYLAFGTQFGRDGDFEELHGFTGKEYDPDIGLFYYNARWYDPDLGRFISEDPAADPNNQNLYSYCGNNPVMRTDPTGKWWQIIVYAVIGGINAQRNGGDFWTGAYVGAVSGALSWGIGEGLGAVGMAEGALSTNIVSGALASGIMSEIMGGDFMDGAGEGALSGLISWGVGKYFGKWGNKNQVNKYIVKGIDKEFNARAQGKHADPLFLIFDMFDIWEIFKGIVMQGKENGQVKEEKDFWESRQDWLHPLKGGPTQDPTTGGRGFGADRSNGRKHAGIDFIAEEGREVIAMTDGTVMYIRDFWAGTQQVVIRNSDGTIARYTEISASIDLKEGDTVFRGSTLGTVIKNTYNGCSMLHLELYMGTTSGPLTVTNSTSYKYVPVKNYVRRSDLIDPTGAKTCKLLNDHI